MYLYYCSNIINPIMRESIGLLAIEHFIIRVYKKLDFEVAFTTNERRVKIIPCPSHCRATTAWNEIWRVFSFMPFNISCLLRCISIYHICLHFIVKCHYLVWHWVQGKCVRRKCLAMKIIKIPTLSSQFWQFFKYENISKRWQHCLSDWRLQKRLLNEAWEKLKSWCHIQPLVFYT